MTKSELKTAEVVVLWWCVLLFSATFLFIFPWRTEVWAWVSKSDAPAWVQAVGSIAAIVAAIRVVNRQHTLELQRMKSSALQDKIALVNAAFQLVGGVYQIAQKIELMDSENSNFVDLRRARTELKGLLQALGRVDHLKFDMYEVIMGILVAESVGSHFDNQLADCQVGLEHGGITYWFAVKTLAEDAMKSIRPVMDRIHTKLTELERLV